MIVWLIVAVAAVAIGWEAMQFTEIAQAAKNAGFTGEDLVIAVAVALAESGGDAQAYNPETAAGTPEGQGSYGLWQIYLKAHPEFLGSNLYDPNVNAQAAYSVWQRSGWGAWSTYNSRTYLTHVVTAAGAVLATL